MFNLMLVLLAIPLVLLFTIGIPIIVGVVVYRDANKRVDCNPWLWALIAALVPSFIGVVIYVIVRRDYPLKPENRQAMDASDDETYYQKNYDNVATDGEFGAFPKWAKVLLIVIAALVILWLAGVVIGVLKYLIMGYPLSYY